MKVLRIFGIVAAVHAIAFLLIMANPGCSTKPKTPPTPASTEPAAASSSPSISVPSAATQSASLGAGPEPAPVNFDPNATAISVPRYTPTRPNTPASSALQAEPVQDVIPATKVTVGKGDSLWSIAKKHNIPVTDLAAANNLKTGATLRVGQNLVVPTKASSSSSHAGSSSHVSASTADYTPAAKQVTPSESSTAKAAPAGAVKHVVKVGETLGSIARKYDVKAGDLAVANNISNPAMIRVGKELVIPGYQTPKSGRSSTNSSSHSTESAAKSAPAAEPAPAKQAPLVMPKIGLPSEDQDLDAGLKPAATTTTVPVIKLDEGPTSAPIKSP